MGSGLPESVHGFELLSDASKEGGSMLAVVDGARVGDLGVRNAVVASSRRRGGWPRSRA